MKCPNEIRECPHGWTDCSLCANLIVCQADTYVPEPEPIEQDPDLISELTPGPEELTADLGIVIPSVRGTWAERLNAMTEDERWQEYYKYHPEDLISKEPITCLSGPVVPGGGSKSRVPKKPQRKVPEYMKILGM